MDAPFLVVKLDWLVKVGFVDAGNVEVIVVEETADFVVVDGVISFGTLGGGFSVNDGG